MQDDMDMADSMVVGIDDSCVCVAICVEPSVGIDDSIVTGIVTMETSYSAHFVAI